MINTGGCDTCYYAGGCDDTGGCYMLYAGGCDTCYIQEVVIHVINVQEVVIHVLIC